MSQLGFSAFDADNHYYEAEDAFTRYMDPKLAKRGIRWCTVDGKKRILIGGRLDRFIPNPTFDPVTKPGALADYFRGRNPEGKTMVELFGDLEPIRPEYRDRDARLKRLDQQGLEACVLFPTLGVGVEEPLRRNAEITHACLHAFNQWLEEDWGFAHQGRLFAVPMISLMDVDAAVAELEWALERDARIVHLRPAPVPYPGGSRSPGDPIYDPFWARVNEAGIVVALHSGESGYGRYAAAWERTGRMQAFRGYAFGQVTQKGRPIFDALAALIIHGVFQRHPRVRVCSIENGAEWVAWLLGNLKTAHAQMSWEFHEPPLDTFRRHISISPFYEDDIRALANAIGVENVLFGSDFPHAEGLAEPVSFVHDLKDFDEDEIRMVMRDNGRRLVTRGVLG